MQLKFEQHGKAKEGTTSSPLLHLKTYHQPASFKATHCYNMDLYGDNIQLKPTMLQTYTWEIDINEGKFTMKVGWALPLQPKV